MESSLSLKTEIYQFTNLVNLTIFVFIGGSVLISLPLTITTKDEHFPSVLLEGVEGDGIGSAAEDPPTPIRVIRIIGAIPETNVWMWMGEGEMERMIEGLKIV